MKAAILPLALVLACGAFAYEGPTFSATVWRGETAYVKVPDNLAGELAAEWKRDSLTGRIAAVEISPFCVSPVSYATTPNGLQLAACKDLVTPYCGEGRTNPSLCRIAVDQAAKPGVYTVGPLSLRVLDRVLPPAKEWKYFLDLWQHPWAVARYWRVEPFSDDHFARMRKVWATLAACGQKTLTVTLLDLPWNHQCYDAYNSMIGRVKGADGAWRFDYSLFDKYVEFGRECGLGPDIACYTMCPWNYVVRWQDEKGETQRAMAKPGTPEFDDYWGAFLVDFAAHLKTRGWFDSTYIAMDERSPEDVRFIAQYVQTKAPGLKIALAGNRKPSDFAGIVIDNYCQVISDVTPDYLRELACRREQGYRTTFYVCCWPPKPNTFMSSEASEAFWLGAYPALSGFDGFLRWAANSWPCNPYAEASFGGWRAGDTYLIYPDGEPSLRLLTLRAGIVAAEKARLLKGESGFDSSLAELAEKYNADKAQKGSFNFDTARGEIEALVNR